MEISEEYSEAFLKSISIIYCFSYVLKLLGKRKQAVVYEMRIQSSCKMNRFKAFTDDKINVAKKLKFVTVRVENIVEKGFFLRVVKSRDILVKG